MFNQDWKMTGYILGSFDEAFVKQGRLKLDEEKIFPENDDEIAMDRNTLLFVGYVGEMRGRQSQSDIVKKTVCIMRQQDRKDSSVCVAYLPITQGQPNQCCRN